MLDEGLSQVSTAQRGGDDHPGVSVVVPVNNESGKIAWIGLVDLSGVWRLIRRKKRIPQSLEVTLAH